MKNLDMKCITFLYANFGDLIMSAVHTQMETGAGIHICVSNHLLENNIYT